ncbi:MAG: HNH endonuclease [Candidatus Thorarchaeota archaeon]
MGKRMKNTPNSVIKKACGRMFLRSRERNRCMKDAVCAECGSDDKKNLQSHHINGINWQRIIKVIREELLTDELEPLCKECHAKKTEEMKCNHTTN